MWKVAAGLLVLAVVLSVAFMGHGLATGIVPPYPDPTPEQAAYVRYHKGISMPLFLASGVAWLATGVVTVASVVRWLFRSRRAI